MLSEQPPSRNRHFAFFFRVSKSSENWTEYLLQVKRPVYSHA